METEKTEPKLTTIEMLRKLQFSGDTNCANLAKKLLANETTLEVELKYAGPFMTYVLTGCFHKALGEANAWNKEALDPDNKFGPKIKYVFLNPETGRFSNSWGEKDHTHIHEGVLAQATKDNWKLIKYECLNDDNFEFSLQMKLR